MDYDKFAQDPGAVLGMRASPPSGPQAKLSIVRRARALALARPGLLLSLFAISGLAAAAITLTYSNTSTLTTSVTPPPVQFVTGTDAGPSTLTDYVTAYAISTNKTYITATVKGVPEASLVVGSFLKLTNVDNAAHVVTLTTTQVSNAYVSAYTIEIQNTLSATQSTLTLTAASPSASVTIPAGETWTGKLTLTLATGAGVNNVALTNALTLAVTA